MGIGRTAVLLWADMMAIYTVLFILITYLTNVWRLGFTHAASIINVFLGLSLMLPLLIKFIVDTVSGYFWMLLISSITHCIGMGFLAMSTPPVLANATGTCSEYRPDCVSHEKRILFYIALPLISLGLSGHLTCWTAVMSGQLVQEVVNIGEGIENNQDVDDDEAFRQYCCMICRFFCATFLLVIFGLASIIAMSYVKPWSIRFGIAAICTVFATLLFLTGLRSYNHDKPQGSSITPFFRVFVASASKLLHESPKDPNELYEIQDSDEDSVEDSVLLRYTKSLRCLDKAAIILSTQPLDEQKTEKWKLCTITEVEKTKIIIRMIPMSITLILCGLIISIGFTYFVEQANHLNPKVLFVKISISELLGVSSGAGGLGGSIYLYIQKLTKSTNISKTRKYAPSIGISISMILAILCCITAAKVEKRRLDIVQSHGLVDNPKAKVPMSILWTIPQFVLFGLYSGLLSSSIFAFFKDQYPVSTINLQSQFLQEEDEYDETNQQNVIVSMYLVCFVMSLLGFGFFANVVSVFVVGKVSERGGKTNWFQHNLNGSRLDKYYWTLAWLMAVNLVIFIVVAMLYRYMDSGLEDQDAVEGAEIPESYNDDDYKCCCC